MNMALGRFILLVRLEEAEMLAWGSGTVNWHL